MTMEQTELLEANIPGKVAGKTVKSADVFKWSLATNHLNVVMMLAAGMILPKSGFGKKYYQDTLDFIPDCIPLFKAAPPTEAIQHCISENKILKPCVVEINLVGLQGEVPVLKEGSWIDLELTDDFDDVDCVLIPAPLALGLVTQIIFPDKDAVKAFREHVSIVNNCPVEGFTIKARQSDFKGKGKFWPLPPHNVTGREEPSLSFADAVGGVIANMNILANSNDNAVSLMSDLRDPASIEDGVSRGTISSRIKEWWQSGGELATGATADVMFWGICTALFQNKHSTDFGSSRDVVLHGFQEAASVAGDKALLKSEEVIADLMKLYQDSDVTFTELLAKHTTPLPRALVLFFVHDDIESVLESNRSVLNDEDIVLFAILAGLSTGWLNLSSENKTYAGLNLPASSLIVKTVGLTSNSAATSINIPYSDELPVSVREFLSLKDWRKAENEVAIALCREFKWPHLKTRISLGEGEYQFEVRRGSMQIVLDGEVKSVSLDVSKDAVLKSLADIGELPDKHENKIGKIFRNTP